MTKNFASDSDKLLKNGKTYSNPESDSALQVQNREAMDILKIQKKYNHPGRISRERFYNNIIVNTLDVSKFNKSDRKWRNFDEKKYSTE